VALEVKGRGSRRQDQRAAHGGQPDREMAAGAQNVMHGVSSTVAVTARRRDPPAIIGQTRLISTQQPVRPPQRRIRGALP
jgi:hypothetical protein